MRLLGRKVDSALHRAIGTGLLRALGKQLLLTVCPVGSPAYSYGLARLFKHFNSQKVI